VVRSTGAKQGNFVLLKELIEAGSPSPGRVELPREIDRGVLQAEDPSNPEILVQLLATSFPSDHMNFYPSGEVWEPNV
jgi:hypothetical protein